MSIKIASLLGFPPDIIVPKSRQSVKFHFTLPSNTLFTYKPNPPLPQPKAETIIKPKEDPIVKRPKNPIKVDKQEESDEQTSISKDDEMLDIVSNPEGLSPDGVPSSRIITKTPPTDEILETGVNKSREDSDKSRRMENPHGNQIATGDLDNLPIGSPGKNKQRLSTPPGINGNPQSTGDPTDETGLLDDLDLLETPSGSRDGSVGQKKGPQSKAGKGQLKGHDLKPVTFSKNWIEKYFEGLIPYLEKIRKHIKSMNEDKISPKSPNVHLLSKGAEVKWEGKYHQILFNPNSIENYIEIFSEEQLKNDEQRVKLFLGISRSLCYGLGLDIPPTLR